MDRRKFLTGMGSLGAATAGGWAALETAARDARAAGLAHVAGAPKAAGRGRPVESGPARPLQQGLTVGFLEGSAALLDWAAQGRSWNVAARPLQWSAWHSSLSRPYYGERVDVSIGLLSAAPVHAAPLLRSLEVVAHFAIDEAPHFAPFNAWQYDAGSDTKRASSTTPLTFEAAMPDRVGLQLNYALQSERLVPGLASSGVVYLPLGGRDGPGTGLYVLAAPSRLTGAPADFTRFRFRGDLHVPLSDDAGGLPDFDYVSLTVAPVAA